MALKIPYFHRYTNQLEEELVYGGEWLRFCYQNPIGRMLQAPIVKPWFSKLYGLSQDHPKSQKKIAGFIKKFSIAMDEFVGEDGSEQGTVDHPPYYSNFNQFFIRKFKPGMRPFVSDVDDKQRLQLAAPAEGRYCGYERISDDLSYPVKGQFLEAGKMLGKSDRAQKWSDTFHGGPLVIARLCPVDYHRFHFPCDAEVIDYYREPGDLYSVNPLALAHRPELFFLNERQICILQTKHFGKIAMVDVGATCVGKIIQSFLPEEGSEQSPKLPIAVKRGEEKGYFLFGGSTVIILGQANMWRPSDDIIHWTNRDQKEVFIKLGDQFAVKA